MRRILSIRNLSVTPLTINGVRLAQNDIYLSDSSNFGYWLTNAYTSLYESNTIQITLTNGASMTFAADGANFTKAFLDTANFYKINEEVLNETVRPQGQVTTTNSTTQTIYELPLPNGLTDFEILVKGYEAGTNNYYKGLFFPSITTVSNASTLSPSFTTASITSRVGFSGGVGANGSVTANKLRITVTGQTGKTILWTVKFVRIN